MYKKIPNINARDFATILNINPYQTPFNLLEQKIEGKFPFFGNKFTDHGNKYESLALKVYEKESKNKVDPNQKNIKHPDYDWITGRLDGISVIELSIINKENKNKRRKVDTNCIVEIKCPLKVNREEPLTVDNIPKYYWSQCQVYMEMINCEYTHYVEYYIAPNAPEDSGVLHYVTIKRDREWWSSALPKIKAYREEMLKYHKLGSLDTHPVRISEKNWEFNLETSCN